MPCFNEISFLNQYVCVMLTCFPFLGENVLSSENITYVPKCYVLVEIKAKISLFIFFKYNRIANLFPSHFPGNFHGLHNSSNKSNSICGPQGLNCKSSVYGIFYMGKAASFFKSLFLLGVHCCYENKERSRDQTKMCFKEHRGG